MGISQQVSADHPLMIAWKTYKASVEFANTKRWAVQSVHTEGSLWAAFEAGFSARATASTAPASGNEQVAAEVVQPIREAQKPASPQDRIDVEGLKAAAEKATRGPRYAVERDNGVYDIRAAGCVTVATAFHPPGHTSEDEAAFIAAACNAVPELIAQREALVMTLAVILPMAKGYAAANRVGRNAEMIAEADALLSTIQAGGAK